MWPGTQSARSVPATVACMRDTPANTRGGPGPTSLDPRMRLFTPDGDPVELGMLAKTPVVVQLVRYFGCLPCQQYLCELDRRSGELTDDATGKERRGAGPAPP